MAVTRGVDLKNSPRGGGDISTQDAIANQFWPQQQATEQQKTQTAPASGQFDPTAFGMMGKCSGQPIPKSPLLRWEFFTVKHPSPGHQRSLLKTPRVRDRRTPRFNTDERTSFPCSDAGLRPPLASPSKS